MRFAPPIFPLQKWIDPDLLGGDTDPLDYSKYIEKMWKEGGVLVTTSMECGGILFSLDPDPQRIRTQPLNTKQFLGKIYVLLVWWGNNRGSAVGWSSCFYVQTNSVPRIRNPLNKASNFLKRKFKKKRNSVMTYLLRQLSASTASFCFNPLLPVPPSPVFFRQWKRGRCDVSLHTQPLKI